MTFTPEPLKPESWGLAVGGPDEASEYFAECGPVWRSTPGAIEWLSRLTATLPANDG